MQNNAVLKSSYPSYGIFKIPIIFENRIYSNLLIILLLLWVLTILDPFTSLTNSEQFITSH